VKNEEFEITKEVTPKGIRFYIKGRVNSINADQLQGELETALKEHPVNIVLNMLYVIYLSSAGIRVILKTYKDAKEAGGTFGIEMASQNVKNVLGMAALDEMLIK
jgi:anti-sigma B factor antagonist